MDIPNEKEEETEAHNKTSKADGNFSALDVIVSY